MVDYLFYSKFKSDPPEIELPQDFLITAQVWQLRETTEMRQDCSTRQAKKQLQIVL